MIKPIHQRDVPATTWYQGTDREITGFPLSDVDGIGKLGFGICELGPGCNTRPAHYHKLEEEHLYVLSGTATLHLGTDKFEMTEGSYVRFPAGQPEAHYVSNDTKEPLRYLMVGERHSEDEVVYPDDE